MYRYKDTVIETEIDDPHLGLIPSRKAEHLSSKVKSVTVYSEDKKRCHIHSDVEILGLETVEEDTPIGEVPNADSV